MAVYTHERREKYSSLILKKLRNELVLKDGIVFNNDYDGDPVSGSVKIPVRDTEVEVSDYDIANGTDIKQGSTTYLPILITKDKAVNELIDGYEAAAVPDNLVADRLDSATYSLAAQLDSDGATILLAEGTPVNVALVDKDNVYDAMVDMRTALSKAKIPLTRRYALVTPDFYALILKSPEFIKASALGDAVVQTGAIGAIAGFTLYEWNDATPGLKCICGHPGWATRINVWKVPVSVNNLTNKHIGASAVQGRMVYEHKVTRGVAVQIMYAPGTLVATAAAGANVDETKITVTGASGSAKYRLNPTARVVYGQADTGFTAVATNPKPAVGDIIEVVDFVSAKAVAVKYISVTAEMIKQA